MRTLVICAVLALAAGKPAPAPGLLGGGWGGIAAPAWPSPVGVVHQPSLAVAQPLVHAPAIVAQPVVHSAPVVAQQLVHAAPSLVHAPAATSYSSFQQVVHPVSVAQPVVHAPVAVAQPIVSAVQTVAHASPVFSSYGHGW